MSNIVNSSIKLIILLFALILNIYYAKKRKCTGSIIIGTTLLFVCEIIHTIYWYCLYLAKATEMPIKIVSKIINIINYFDKLASLPMDIFLIIVLITIHKQYHKKEIN